MPDELLTPDELGARLRLQPETIITWARQRRIPSIRLSRKVIRFRMGEVIAALEAAASVPARSGVGAGP